MRERAGRGGGGRRGDGRADSHAKRAFFTGFTLLTPLLFFLLLEGGLRVAGFGSGYPLFVHADADGELLRMNPEVGHRFFTGDFVLPGVTRDVFQARKDEDTYRIVAQGASTVLGYPYFHGAAFPRMLERRLSGTFPQRRIEVVNTAMVAVNSYTLLDFADEIVAVRPDAVLVYAGHNEYYGALGVASSQRVRGSRRVARTWLALRRLRTAQLLERAVAVVRRDDDAGAADEERTWSSWSDLVPYGSPLYERGLEQFRANLEDLLERYRRAGIPVFLATIVSNERDQRPFVSEVQPGIDPAEWEAAVDGAVARLAGAEDPDEAAAAARERLAPLMERDSMNAAAFFGAARGLDDADEHGLAGELYAGARDRDHLRFRAPAALNAVIRELADRPGVHLVDVEAAFLARSPQGIVGGALLHEHVHPRIAGHFEIADAFYEALRRENAIGEWRRPVPRSAARQDLPHTAVDSIYGELLVHELTSGWPFAPGEAAGRPLSPVPPSDPVVRLGEELYRRRLSWPEAMQALYEHHYQAGDARRARNAARALAREYPELPTPHLMWGMAALRSGDTDEAVGAARRAHSMSPSHRTSFILGLALLAAGQRDSALPHLEDAATEAPPEEPGPQAALQAAHELAALEAAAAQRPDDPSALQALAEARAALHQIDRAITLARRVLELDPSHDAAAALLERLGAEAAGSSGPDGGALPAPAR